MKDRSEIIWADIANRDTETLKRYMYSSDRHTPLLFIDDSKKYKILDFGCGLGRNLPYLRTFASELHGYDIPNMIRRCPIGLADKLIDNFDELKKEKYDLIVCYFVIQFFCDVEYLQYILTELSKLSPYIYIVTRCYMEDANHSNVFNEISKNKDVVLEGSDKSYLYTSNENYPSQYHFECILKSEHNKTDIIPHVLKPLGERRFIYKSYADLAHDVREWSKKLPKLSGVIGIPRSGNIVATMLSEYLHIPYYTIEGFKHNLSFRPKASRRLNKFNYPVLAVDDTSWSGRAIADAKEYLEDFDEVMFGAVYVSQKAADRVVDEYYQIFTSVMHTFEWNFFRDYMSQHYMCDMDGVICEDWCGKDDSVFVDEYMKHLQNARKIVFPQCHIYSIVTSRLNKWRQQTVDWLAKNGIAYSNLVMSPYSSEKERLDKNGFGHWKAEIYKADTEAVVFVESDDSQAKLIYQLTGKPTFSTERMQAYGHDTM